MKRIPSALATLGKTGLALLRGPRGLGQCQTGIGDTLTIAQAFARDYFLGAPHQRAFEHNTADMSWALFYLFANG